jgi:hypothetical protein
MKKKNQAKVAVLPVEDHPGVQEKGCSCLSDRIIFPVVRTASKSFFSDYLLKKAWCLNLPVKINRLRTV